MGIFTFVLINCVASEELLIAGHTGTVFQPIKDAVFYTDNQKAVINIKLPSPRVKLNYLAYGNCFVCDDRKVVDECEPQFGYFDEKILDFLHLDLVKNGSAGKSEDMDLAEKPCEKRKSSARIFVLSSIFRKNFERSTSRI